jgi:hypothetical protein
MSKGRPTPRAPQNRRKPPPRKLLFDRRRGWVQLTYSLALGAIIVYLLFLYML